MTLPAHAKLHYRARFSLVAKDSTPPDWGAVAKKILFWIVDRVDRNDAFNRGKWYFVGGEWAPPGGQGVRVETKRFVGAGMDTAPDYWTIRFEHPCRDVAHRRWRTDIGLARQANGEIEVSVTNFHWLTPGYIGEEPEAPTPASPVIVLDLVNHPAFNAVLGASRLSSRPLLLNLREGMEFRELLATAERECPIVLVTHDRFTGEALLNAGKLARLLAGNALVYVAADRELDDELEWTIPAEFRCRSGMVRVYLPGLQFDSPRDARRHRFFLARDIQGLGANVVEGLIVEALSRRYAPSAKTFVESFEDIADVEQRAALDSALKLAREGAKDQEFVAFCDGEVKRIQAENKSLAEDRNQATTRADTAENLLKTERYLRQEAERQLRDAQDTARQNEELRALAAERGVPVLSLVQAIETIERMFPDRIVFTAEAKQSAERAGFNELRDEMAEAWRMLWHLATTMHDLCLGSESYAGKLDDVFRQRSGGIDITLTERKLTKADGEARAARRVIFEGKELDITPHLKLGRDPDTCLRVHFAAHRRADGTGVIVIGHCGDHKKTAGTRKRG
ncbi:MAG: hypothetical protein JNG88_18005 [Phycisphaerales bacterium]|nr:hypothetical protein [Phycisphaerales bacterium]